MPHVRPVPIKTKGLSKWEQVKVLATVTRKWEVLEDWIYRLGKTLIIIPQGFIFDGASIPKFLRWLVTPVHVLFLPGLIHDFAYRYDYLWCSDNGKVTYQYWRGGGKEFWDRLFLQIALDMNGMDVLDFLAWVAVRWGGSGAWEENCKLGSSHIYPRTFDAFVEIGVEESSWTS